MIDTGGPAFPVVGRMYGEKLGGQLDHGMTLRDYFAAKAMQGMLATSEKLNMEPGRKAASADDFAKLAYLCADAMLAERSKA